MVSQGRSFTLSLPESGYKVSTISIGNNPEMAKMFNAPFLYSLLVTRIGHPVKDLLRIPMKILDSFAYLEL